jgi:hypothetical protein
MSSICARNLKMYKKRTAISSEDSCSGSLLQRQDIHIRGFFFWRGQASIRLSQTVEHGVENAYEPYLTASLPHRNDVFAHFYTPK